MSEHLILPPDSFYWAIVDRTLLNRRTNNRETGLGYLFENILPVPIENVQTVYHDLAEGKTLACGMERQTLQTFAGVGEAITLTPTALPVFIDLDVNPDTLNLLTGHFEPKRIRWLRRRWLINCLVLILLCSIVLTAGLQRRIRVMETGIEQLHARQIELYEHSLADIAGEHIDSGTTRAVLGGRAQPIELRFLAELRRLRQTRGKQPGEQRLVDASKALTSLLARWPRDLNTQFGESDQNPLYLLTESISITPTALSLRGTVPSSDDAQRLAEYLRGIEGWTMRQPELRSAGDTVQTTLRFIPEMHEEGGEAS